MKQSCLRFALLTGSIAVTFPAQAYFAEIELYTGAVDATYDFEERDYFLGTYTDVDTTVKETRHHLDLEFFFKNTGTVQGPLEQSAFLDKAGSAYIGYSQSDIEVEGDISLTSIPSFSSNITYSTEFIKTGARIIIGPVILEPAYSRENTERKVNSPSLLINDEYTTKMLELGIGGYISNRQELVFTYSKGESELKKFNISIPGFIPIIYTSPDTTITYQALRYKGVFPVTQNFFISPHAVIHNYSYEDTSQRILEAGVIFYPLKNLGVGPTLKLSSESEYAYNSSNNEMISTINVSYFPIPDLGINASIGSTTTFEKLDDLESDSNSYDETTDESSGILFQAGITGRF